MDSLSDFITRFYQWLNSAHKNWRILSFVGHQLKKQQSKFNLSISASLLHNSQLNSVRENLVHVEAVQGVFLWTEAQVAGIVEPQRQRVPVSHQEPLPDIKLGVVYQEWTLWHDTSTLHRCTIMWMQTHMTQAKILQKLLWEKLSTHTQPGLCLTGQVRHTCMTFIQIRSCPSADCSSRFLTGCQHSLLCRAVY